MTNIVFTHHYSPGQTPPRGPQSLLCGLYPGLPRRAHSGLSLATGLSPHGTRGSMRIGPEAPSFPAISQHRPAQSLAQKRYQ